MKRFTLTLLAAAVVVFQIARTGTVNAAAATTSSAPVPPSFFGVTLMDSKVEPIVPFSTVRTWDSWPRVPWSYLNPAKDVFKYYNLDLFLSENAGRDIIYTLGRTPVWASSKPEAHTDYGPGQCAPPTNIADWDNYVRTVATHVAGKIKYWELWNEPMNSKYYCGDMPAMVQMAQHARSIIKSIDPSAMILAPSTDKPFGEVWLRSFLSQGGAATIDIMTIHGYPDNSPEGIVPMLAQYHALMAVNGVGTLPIWDTEQDGGSHSEVDVAKMYLLEWSSGISRSVWYAYDIKSGKPLWDAATGLTPTGIAYKEVYKWMVGASLPSPCSSDAQDTWRCELLRPHYHAVAIWNSQTTVNVPTPASFKEYRDLSGTVHPITAKTVSVGNSPILLESGQPPF